MTTGSSQAATQTSCAQAEANGFDYIISGLSVRSQLELPSAIRAEMPHEDPDVTIRVGAVPESLPSPDRSGRLWASEGDAFWLHLRGIMRVLVTGGRTIVAEPDAQLDPDDLVIYLLGTAFAVILQQRSRIVMHASAVVVNGRAMLFCGQSGAGKSTMAALLGRRGYPLLNDDVCSLSLSEGGEYAVHPDGRMLKLWSKSMDHLEWGDDVAPRVRRDLEKFYKAPEQVDLSPRPVGGVYMLSPLEGEGCAFLQELPTAEAMVELLKNAYRPVLVEAMGMTSSYFQMATSVKQRAEIFRLTRPMEFNRADEALDLLEESWSRTRV